MTDPAPQVSSSPWHVQTREETVAKLRSDASRGLAEKDAATLLSKHGPNALALTKKQSNFALLVHQFRSLIVGLLVAAAGVAFVLGDVAEAVAILIVIVINAGIGFGTEWKAASALEGLRKQTISVARIVRDGEERQIPSEELVPGDLVLLAAGDRVPADGRVIEQARLQVDEAALTGESHPIAKAIEPVADADAALGDRTSMVFMGSGVSDGRGKFVVTETGANTEMGKIGTLLEEVEEHVTPLEKKLGGLSRTLLFVVLVLCAVIVFVGWLRGIALLYMVEVGISLAIAAVPEGLLAVTTMTLAVGMQRMAKMNALVRRLPAVESLGSTTVICTDKTGTLTRNEMTVRAYDVAGRRVDVSGTGYVAAGSFSVDANAIDPKSDSENGLSLALRIGVLCNDAKLERSGDQATVLGDPTEAALIVAAEKAGFIRADLERDYPRKGEVPFSSETKRMATVHTTPEGNTVSYVKGAPATVLDASVAMLGGGGVTPMSDELRAKYRTANDALAASALRVLAIGYRDLPAQYSDEDLTKGLTRHDRSASRRGACNHRQMP